VQIQADKPTTAYTWYITTMIDETSTSNSWYTRPTTTLKLRVDGQGTGGKWEGVTAIGLLAGAQGKHKDLIRAKCAHVC
jgi:hypothetical protein